jgi:hypothetical protein
VEQQHYQEKIGFSSISRENFFWVVRVRVARWFLFKPKLPIWVNFGGPQIENVDIFYGHLEYFKDI